MPVEPASLALSESLRVAHESVATDADGHYCFLGYVIQVGGCCTPVMIAHHHGMFAFSTVLPEFIDDRAVQLDSAATLVRAQVGTEYDLTTLN